MKKLTICGAGVAGSYLHALLIDKHPEVGLKIYDGAGKVKESTLRSRGLYSM